jgi:paraquat-inducible protein A
MSSHAGCEESSGFDLRSLIACPDCDLLHRRQELPTGGHAACSRCGARLYRKPWNSIESTLVMAITALILLVVANCSPFMSFQLHGRVQEAHIITGVFELYAENLWALAGVILFVSIVAPALTLLLLLYITLPLYLDRVPPGLVLVYRVYDGIRAWGMIGIYMLGALVAINKLSELATTPVGAGFWALVALMFVAGPAQARLDPQILWDRLEAQR